MQSSINLSKLVCSPYGMQLFREEALSFDLILSDAAGLAGEKEVQMFNKELSSFFAHLKPANSVLVILEQLNFSVIAPYLQKFERVIVLDAFSGMASLGKKLHPELNLIAEAQAAQLNICFPFDLEQLLKNIKNQTSTLIALSNQEVPENLYASTEDEELQFIDKKLIDQADCLSLLSPESPDLLLIGTGNQLEELVKLSQHLSLRPEKIGLEVLGKWSLLEESTL